MLRDGDDCPVTGFCFFPPSFVPSRCAHLIPFSIHSKVVLYHFLDDAYPYLSIYLSRHKHFQRLNRLQASRWTLKQHKFI